MVSRRISRRSPVMPARPSIPLSVKGLKLRSRLLSLAKGAKLSSLSRHWPQRKSRNSLRPSNCLTSSSPIEICALKCHPTDSFSSFFSDPSALKTPVISSLPPPGFQTGPGRYSSRSSVRPSSFLSSKGRITLPVRSMPARWISPSGSPPTSPMGLCLPSRTT